MPLIAPAAEWDTVGRYDFYYPDNFVEIHYIASGDN